MAIKLSTAAAAYPISYLDDIKPHLRLTDDNNQPYLTGLIPAATAWAEHLTERALITQTWKLILSAFPADPIRLPFPPLQSVTTVKYYDSANAQQTLSASVYQVDTNSEPGTLQLAASQSWPAVYDRVDAVEITFVAGYGANRTAVPPAVRQAILFYISHWYFNRKEVELGNMAAVEIPDAGAALLNAYRVFY